MMDAWEEAELLRERIADLEGQIAAEAQDAPDGQASVVVRTTAVAVSYPTTPNVYYACIVQHVSGPTTEGSAATFTPAAGYLLAYNVGTAIPPENTHNHVADWDGTRYVFAWNG